MEETNGGILISIVGAGPGAYDLLTLRAVDRLNKADVVIWASSLIPAQVLNHTNADAQLFDSASMTFEDVAALYKGSADCNVVRLHSGDPSIYGAIQEQIDFIIENNLDFEIVPGVTSVAAAAAILGRELTIPGAAQTVVFTRLARKTAASVPEGESVEAYARLGGTLAVFLSGAYPTELQEALLCENSAYSSETPAAVVVRASWPDEKVIMTTCGHLAESMKDLGARRTVLVLVGSALQQSPLRSHLYSPSFAHKFRKRSAAGETKGRPTSATRASLR